MKAYAPASLLAAVRAIETGEVSPLEAFDRFARRALDVEPAIGAFAASDWEAARQLVGMRSAGPLRGLPVGIKDNLDTAFLPTAIGSPIYAGRRPAADAAIVERVAQAGGTVPAKTTTTEFAFFTPTGTRNPSDPARTPGGSSAGSAAAVAAGMIPAAIGTQTAGSVLRPASFCGVTGFKPSFGWMPADGLKPFAPSFDTVGLFAATVADARFFFSALTGSRDDAATPDPASLRMGIVRTPWDNLAHERAVGVLESAAAKLAKARASLADLPLPAELVAAQDAHITIQSFEVTPLFTDERAEHRDLLSPVLAAYLDEAATVDADAYRRAIAVRDAARQTMAPLFERFDALLTFAAPDIAPADGTTGSPVFNKLWTLLGTPAIALAGASVAGMPVGLQFVGAIGGDERLLAVAEAVEKIVAGIEI